jgi:hypothetical protein
LEQTLPDLQAQIDQLSLALRQWRETQDLLQPMEQRLSILTERCAEILNRWTDTDQRHADAIKQVEAKLNDWTSIEQRLEQDSLQRIREFEGTIEHEWAQLRQMHAEPVKQLREQTAALGETCVAAANLALRGFERAEARFAALEADLQERLSQLSHDVQSALTDLKQEVGHPAPLKGAAPFQLDGVMKLHDEMRDAGGAAGPAQLPPGLAGAPPPASDVPIDVKPVQPQADAAAALSARLDSLEREVTTIEREVLTTNAEVHEVHESVTQTERMRRGWRLSFGVAAALVAIVAFAGIQLIGSVNRRLNEATTRVANAERQAQAASEAATKQMASTRAEADRQIAEAQATALRAQLVSNVLAAPDLIRFNLASPNATTRASAQALLSRSRGFVFSASRLPAPPDGSAYQVWLLTDGGAVSLGTIVPDAAGRASMSLDAVPSIPRAITGIVATTEPAAGSAAPTGDVVLARRAVQ